MHAARQPPDEDHPYGHRKYETVAAAAVTVFLLLLVIEVRAQRLQPPDRDDPQPHEISTASFVVMLVTVGVNLGVVAYESRAAERLGSEVLLADAMQTRGDVWSSLTVIGALVGARLGVPILDPLAALVVAGFIGYAGFQVARATTGILSDRIVISDADLATRGDERARRDRLRKNPHAWIGRPCVPGSARLDAARHAADRSARRCRTSSRTG